MEEFIVLGDEKLMQEIKLGDMIAFDTLYKKYCKRLYKFAYSILKCTEDSENIVQDVFLNLWENRNKVEKDSSIKYYIFTIAYNSVISIIRQKARDEKFVEYMKSIQELNQAPVNIEIEYNELTKKLDDIINRLPERQKEVYLLHKVEGLKYQAISEKLNISVNTVGNHMSRAIKTIQRKLGIFSLGAILFIFFYV